MNGYLCINDISSDESIWVYALYGHDTPPTNRISQSLYSADHLKGTYEANLGFSSCSMSV